MTNDRATDLWLGAIGWTMAGVTAAFAPWWGVAAFGVALAGTAIYLARRADRRDDVSL